MTENGIIAPDTNLLRNPSPGRYLAALEALRGRRIAILPLVAHELRMKIPEAAADDVRRLCRWKGIGSTADVDVAIDEAVEAAAGWLPDERGRNDSVYLHLPDLGIPRYRSFSGRLPGDAFTDRNGNDRIIYAQAWAHGIDVLGSRNRTSILLPLLEEHFTALGHSTPPVTVRGLFDHTAHISRTEGRAMADVALEAVLGAVIPDAWTSDHTVQVMSSCAGFIGNLALSSGRRDSMASLENQLVSLLNQCIGQFSHEEFAKHCERAHANRPVIACETEMRYHRKVRTAVRETGLDPWG